MTDAFADDYGLETFDKMVLPMFSHALGTNLPEHEDKQFGEVERFIASACLVMAFAAQSDGHITGDEKKLVNKHLCELAGISDEDEIAISERLFEYIDKSKLDRTTLFRCMENLSVPQRLMLVFLMYDTSWSDQHLHENEKDVIDEFLSEARVPSSKYMRTLMRDILNVKHLSDIAENIKTDTELKKILPKLRDMFQPSTFEQMGPGFVSLSRTINNKISSLVVQIQETQPREMIDENFKDEINQVANVSNDLHKMTVQFVDKVENDEEVSGILPEITFQKIEHLENAKELLNRLKDKKFKVLVLGQFSAGKSTFINALLGQELLPVNASPCTAAINIIRHLKSKPKESDFRFFKKEGESEIEIDEIQFRDQIQKKNDSTDEENQEPNELILETDLDLCENGIVIVDTPGLNDDENMTAITEKYLKEADVVIFLTNAQQAFPDDERQLIDKLLKEFPALQFYFVATMWDAVEFGDREGVIKNCKNHLRRFPRIRDKEFTFLSPKMKLETQDLNDEYVLDFQIFKDELLSFIVEERGFNQVLNAKKLIDASMLQTTEDLTNLKKKEQSRIKESKQKQLALLEKEHNGEIQKYEDDLAKLSENGQEILSEIKKRKMEFPKIVSHEFRAAINDIAKSKLPKASGTWKSDLSLWFPGNKGKIAKAFGEKGGTLIEKQLKLWQNQKLPSLFKKEMAQIEDKFKEQLNEIGKIVKGLKPPKTTTNSKLKSYEEEGALLSLLKAGTGMLIGPGAAFAGMQDGWGKLFAAGGIQIGAGIITVLVIGSGPIGLAVGVVAGLTYAAFQDSDETKDEIRKKAVETLQNAILEIPDKSEKDLEKGAIEFFDAFYKQLADGLNKEKTKFKTKIDNLKSKGPDKPDLTEEEEQELLAPFDIALGHVNQFSAQLDKKLSEISQRDEEPTTRMHTVLLKYDTKSEVFQTFLNDRLVRNLDDKFQDEEIGDWADDYLLQLTNEVNAEVFELVFDGEKDEYESLNSALSELKGKRKIKSEIILKKTEV